MFKKYAQSAYIRTNKNLGYAYFFSLFGGSFISNLDPKNSKLSPSVYSRASPPSLWVTLEILRSLESSTCGQTHNYVKKISA